MKVCKRALYVQVIDGIGTVRACSWLGFYLLGNLRDNTMKEIYNSEAAKRFRQTLVDGTYDYCNEENCPYMANNNLDSFMVEVDEFPEYPEMVSLAYDRRCNYHCTCCSSRGDERPDPDVERKIESEIQAALPYVKEFSANGLGEFFVSDSIVRLVSEWKPKEKEQAKFSLETNGSLFTPENWEKIKNIGDVHLDVAITIHSFEEAAYQWLSGTKLPVERIEDNLRFVKKLRQEGKIDFLELAMVMQERNFRTLPEYIDRCISEFGADRVRIRRFVPEKAMEENMEWFFDIRNPHHPYHQEYLQVMKHPIFKDPHVYVWTGDHLSNRGELPAKGNYRVFRNLFFIENVGKKLTDYLREKGMEKIILYAVSEIGEALIRILKDQPIEILYIYDRNTHITEWNGYKVKTPTCEALTATEEPLLVTLASRYGEIVEYVQGRGYKGDILSLDKILEEFRKAECGC